MAHYFLIKRRGQSIAEGRNSVSGIPWITSGAIANVWGFNGTAIVPWNVNNIGPTGIGTSWANSNSTNMWGCVDYALHLLSSVFPNLLCLCVTNGGSRLHETGSNNANGTWSHRYGLIPGGTPALLQAYETRYNQLIAYLESQGHTWTDLPDIFIQGHADDPAPYFYETDWAENHSYVRSNIYNNPDHPLIHVGVPILSAQYNSEIARVQKAYSDNPLNNSHWISPGLDCDFIDSTHEGPLTSLAEGDWIAKKVISLTFKTEPISKNHIQSSLDGFFVPTKNIYPPEDFFKVAGYTDLTQETATENFYNNLVASSLWDPRYPKWLLIGGDALKHALNFSNPRIYKLGFTNNPGHSAQGVQMNGSAQTVVNTPNIIRDLKDLDTNNFAIDIYSGTNLLVQNSCEFAILQGGGECGARLNISFNEGSPNTGKTRFEIQASGVQPFEFLLRTPVADANSQGLYRAQIRQIDPTNSKAELIKSGVVSSTFDWTYKPKMNSKIQFGSDGTRFSNLQYRYLAISPPYIHGIGSQGEDYAQAVQQLQTDLLRNV